MANLEITTDGPGDEVAAEFEPVHSVRVHCERLALLLVVATVGVVLQYGLQGFGFAREANGFVVGQDDFNWGAFLSMISFGGYIFNSLLLAAALGLILLAPGVPGRLGVVVANALSVVGVVVASLALLAIEEGFRAPSEGGFVGPSAGRGGVTLEQFAQAAGFLPSALVAGFVAYTAWRLLSGGWGSPDVESDAGTGVQVDSASTAAVEDEAWAQPPGSEAWAPEGER